MAIKNTKLTIDVETSKYERGMRNIRRTSRQTSQKIASQWKGIAGVFAGVAGVSGLGAIAKDSFPDPYLCKVQQK